MGQTEENQLRK